MVVWAQLLGVVGPAISSSDNLLRMEFWGNISFKTSEIMEKLFLETLNKINKTI